MKPGAISIGTYLADVEVTLADLARRDVMKRMWREDHTVWKPGPAEISNRLGWLTVSGLMQKQTAALEAFASEVREAGFRHVVLLGMGGSSLGAEVLRQVFGSAKGYPELIVLDSTVPASVQKVAATIDPAKTLFLVSSKSGTTAEPLALFHYFRVLVESAVGRGKTGQNFVAITDPGTPLTGLAVESGFRRIFLNRPDIGGRYSVLSYFGLVPAALIGVNIKELLKRALGMQKKCAANVILNKNPGAWLGACISTLTQKGRDKLTLITSPAVSSFGLWVEQLVAESTGKEGEGVIPVAGEPLVAPQHYGNDRFFIYLRLENDNNSATDAAVERLRSAGQPVVTYQMRDKHDLGAEFFRWEFATAVAGAILGIHPFDQPNVQEAKDATEKLLQKYVKSGHLPQAETTGYLADLMGKAKKKDRYLAIMAYVVQTPEIDAALADLRRKVLERYHTATTLGYGPRFLHSTGQLHKGGPNKGLFIQITTEHQTDLPIPGKPYTFGILADAQALGDYQALRSLRRHIIKVHFRRGDEAAIANLLAGLWKQLEPVQ
ncbi:glucose-6-phosphate isomerase [Chloroflexota bacterium]